MKMKNTFLLLSVVFLTLNTQVYSEENSAESSLVNNQITKLVNDLFMSVPDKKMGVAVLPFETSEGRSEARDLGEAAAILINENLVKNPNISVAEREKLQEIVEEIGLSQTGLTTNEIEVGNLLNAEYIITGAVADLGSRFLLAARFIDVETGNVLQSASVEIPSQSFLSISSKLVVVKKFPVTAAFRSMIIPGWGQFYNDQPGKGSILLGTELVAAVATISTYMLYKQSKGHYDRATEQHHAIQYFDEMEQHAQMNWISAGVLGSVWLYAVLDSYFEAKKQIAEYNDN